MLTEKAMKTKVISINVDSTVGDGVNLLIKHHIGTLPVVDDDGRLVGLLRLADVLHLFLPDFVWLLDDFDFVTDFGEGEDPKAPRGEGRMPMADLMSEPLSVATDSGLLRAWAMLEQHNLIDLPVIDKDNRLVGIASRADIGTCFLTHWIAEHRRPDEAE